MTLQEFIDKWNGKGLDYDGAYGFQCTDVYRQYTKEVVQGKQSPPVAGAVNIWDTYLPEVYTRTANKPDNAPKPGDVIIWGTQLGQYGHVAICVEANTNNFTSFDQNYPIGSVCHLQKHTYVGVLGWLHPKGVPTPPLVTPEPPTDPDRVRVAVGGEWGIMEVQAIRSTLNDQKKLIASLDGSYKEEKTAKEAAMKECATHLDEIWEKLRPIGKEKNWPNVLGEIEGLLHKEDLQESAPTAESGLIYWFISLFKKKWGERS